LSLSRYRGQRCKAGKSNTKLTTIHSIHVQNPNACHQ
jgi:hypothetical protein